jgi:E3 ubiquitin-protein ligase NEDD4
MVTPSEFDHFEFELLLTGVPTIAVPDWVANTDYRGGYDSNDPTVLMFWRCVEEFDAEQRAALLKFSTGTSKVPLEGFAGLRGAGDVCHFCICRQGGVESLPRAHCCFNRLDLPPYTVYNQLKQKLLQAITMAHEGFEIN